MLSKTAYSLEQMRSMIAKTPFHACKVDVKGIGFQIRLQR
jgi:hypothetical protein